MGIVFREGAGPIQVIRAFPQFLQGKIGVVPRNKLRPHFDVVISTSVVDITHLSNSSNHQSSN